MLTLNESKKQACMNIKKLIDVGSFHEEDIYFAMLEKYGLSKKFVTQYITMLKERGFAFSDKNGILSSGNLKAIEKTPEEIEAERVANEIL